MVVVNLLFGFSGKDGAQPATPKDGSIYDRSMNLVFLKPFVSSTCTVIMSSESGLIVRFYHQPFVPAS